MRIGNKEYAEIIITTKEGEILVVISDTEIIEKDGVAVVLKN